MKKATLLSIMLLVIFITNNAHAQKKYSDVRLKENGWIRIVKSSVEETSPEKSMIDSRKRMVKDGLIKRDNFRDLHVKIQFLKACNATTRADTMDKVPLSKKEEEVVNALITWHEEGEKGKQMHKDLLKKYGDEVMNIEDDFMNPKFRCDYRIKVFTTFFSSKKNEIETIGIVPTSEWIKENMEVKRKKEMVPGEITSVTFSIPNAAESWQVWVPK